MPEDEAPQAPAGLARRLAAILYDALILFALTFIAAFVILQLFGEPLDRVGRTVLQVSAVTIAYGYFVGFWTHGGQTVGMRAWRIRLTDPRGGPVAWRAATWRFLGAVVSWLAAGMGFWWSLLDPRRRAWHDRWSQTRLQRLR